MGDACAVYPIAIGTLGFYQLGLLESSWRVKMRIGLIVAKKIRPAVAFSLISGSSNGFRAETQLVN